MKRREEEMSDSDSKEEETGVPLYKRLPPGFQIEKWLYKPGIYRFRGGPESIHAAMDFPLEGLENYLAGKLDNTHVLRGLEINNGETVLMTPEWVVHCPFSLRDSKTGFITEAPTSLTVRVLQKGILNGQTLWFFYVICWRPSDPNFASVLTRPPLGVIKLKSPP